MYYTKHCLRGIFWRIFPIIILLTVSGCEKALNLKEAASNPINIFNETWKVLDEQYALFPIKSVDWNKTYKKYQSQLTDNSTEQELFTTLSGMIETLQDGHVTLISGAKIFTYEGFHTLYPSNFNYSNIVRNYLINDYDSIGPVIYKIQSNVGYMYYSSFRNKISEEQVDELFDKMKDVKGLIIDVRNNTGGNSADGDEIFRRLISEKKLVKYEVIKKGVGHNDFSDPEPYYLSPNGIYFNKPICVLTNRTCFSACNDFVLYMSQLPNVTIIGDQTGGGGGVPYDYILANGWKLQYTATITLSPEKMAIENGIKPTISIEITPADENAGKDPILEKAYELLN